MVFVLSSFEHFARYSVRWALYAGTFVGTSNVSMSFSADCSLTFTISTFSTSCLFISCFRFRFSIPYLKWWFVRGHLRWLAFENDALLYFRYLIKHKPSRALLFTFSIFYKLFFVRCATDTFMKLIHYSSRVGSEIWSHARHRWWNRMETPKAWQWKRWRLDERNAEGSMREMLTARWRKCRRHKCSQGFLWRS